MAMKLFWRSTNKNSGRICGSLIFSSSLLKSTISKSHLCREFWKSVGPRNMGTYRLTVKSVNPYNKTIIQHLLNMNLSCQIIFVVHHLLLLENWNVSNIEAGSSIIIFVESQINMFDDYQKSGKLTENGPDFIFCPEQVQVIGNATHAFTCILGYFSLPNMPNWLDCCWRCITMRLSSRIYFV